MKKNYPEGTVLNRWVLMNETREDGKLVPVIRRWVYLPNGAKNYERYPATKYKHLRENLKELKDYVTRLNGEDPTAIRVKRIVEFRHAYISPELLDHYYEFLKTQIPGQKHANAEFSQLQRYCLGFFIVKLKKPNPLEWHLSQDLWAKALLNKIEKDDPLFKDEWRLFEPNEIMSAKTLKSIVIAMNRFMAFLHQKRPNEVPPLLFKPISRALYKELEARRQMEGRAIVRKFIKDEHWQIIRGKLPDDIRIWALLAYDYGLRRGESMALDLSVIKKDHLTVIKQLLSLPQPDQPMYGPLKGRSSRKIPHWFCTPAQTYHRIRELDTLMHPGTLSHKWSDLMKKLGMDYDFHDLRHTWITKAIRLPNVVPRDVQLAAGHKNIETTMAYTHDDRVFGEEPFVPPLEEALDEVS